MVIESWTCRFWFSASECDRHKKTIVHYKLDIFRPHDSEIHRCLEYFHIVTSFQPGRSLFPIFLAFLTPLIKNHATNTDVEMCIDLKSFKITTFFQPERSFFRFFKTFLTPRIKNHTTYIIQMNYLLVNK